MSITNNQALTDIKVLDFGWGLVGSITGKYLGDFGAQVIRVESSKRMDMPRMNPMLSMSSAKNPDDKPWFTHLNTSKYSLRLNLKHPKAKEVVERLIRWADVINENFSPGTLTKLGFDYEFAKAIKPQIIMVSGSVYGQTGPHANRGGIDGNGAALSGYLDATGWPDRGPVIPNVPYGDVLVPLISITAVAAALDYRRRTGEGQYIDSSMLEICTHQMTPALLDLVANNNLQTRNGNRVIHAAPHAVFPCLGDDQWIAIAVFTDDEWNHFCRIMGNPSWTKAPEFATLESRKQNEDELEERVSQWTRNHSAEEVMKTMQASGVPAGIVQSMQDLYEHDPQLKDRGFLVDLEHPVIGIFGHPAPPFKLSETPAQVRTSPCFGEHTRYICTEFLGMTDNMFNALEQQGVFE
ncbi:MAG: CoA transferase [Deltaproteobacteria bacterium]|nr:CoA transferase [Deltaproteobacteria bacterium]